MISFSAHAQKLVRQSYFFHIFFTLLTELFLLGLSLGYFLVNFLGWVLLGLGAHLFGCALKPRPKVCYITTAGQLLFLLRFSDLAHVKFYAERLICGYLPLVAYC